MTRSSLFKKLFLTEYYEGIPEDDIIAKQRFILFRIFTLFSAIGTIIVALQTYFFLNVRGFAPTALVMLTVILVLNYFALLRHKNNKVTYWVMVISIFALIHILTYFAGGIRNSGMLYLGAIILTTFMLLGNKAGKVFTVLSFIHLIYFYFITENTDWISNILIGDDKMMIDQDFLITGILSLLLISAQCNSLESSKNIVIQRVNLSRIQLQEKNEELKKLSLVASKTNNGVIITDHKGRTEWVNEGFTKLTGFSFDQILHRIPTEILKGPESSRAFQVELNDAFKSADTYNGELQKFKSDGETIWLQIEMTPILDEHDHLERFVFILSDIQERKMNQFKMEEYLRNLEKTNQELDKFAYVVSHDLKAPLRAIGNLTGLIEMEMSEKMTEVAGSSFETIKGRVARMEALINGLLAYARADKQTSELETLNMDKYIHDLIDFIGLPANCKIKLGEFMPVIRTDRIKLQQVLINLISNSINYNDKEDIRINVTIEDKGEFLQFSVEDNGPGIDPKYHEKVFVIFQTLQPRDKFESTGVGLAIVKKIVEDMGGEIWIDSLMGIGSSFRFTWPKNEIAQQPEPVTKTNQSSHLKRVS